MTGTASDWVGIVMSIVKLVAMKPMQQFVSGIKYLATAVMRSY